MRHARVHDAPPPRRVNGRAVLLVGATVVMVTALVVVLLIAPKKRGASAAAQGEISTINTPPTPIDTGTTSGLVPKAKIQLGLFNGTDSGAVNNFSDWLGHPVTYVTDFSDRNSWDNIVDPGRVLKEWKSTDYRLIEAVPLLPDDAYPTKEKSMRAGAAGKYDVHFSELAKKLVAGGQEDAVLRIGWEFNLPGWPWGIDDTATFKTYFRHVVKAMRTVPGAKFTIDWNVNNGYNPNDGTKYYPGDSYVDTIGVDVYDLDGTVYDTKSYHSKKCDAACKEEARTRAWDEVIYGGPRGLAFWTDFAAKHNKPIGLPEWGLWDRPDGSGGGDNPFFIEQMHTYIATKTNNVSYASYFNLDNDDGLHNLEDSFPVSAKRFHELFGT